MKTNIAAWGNSLAVRIPKELVRELSLEKGVEVELRAEGGRLLITPVGKPRYDLAELVCEISPENLHGELSWGPAEGTEAW